MGGWKFGAGSKCSEVVVAVAPVCVQIKASGRELEQVIDLLIIVIALLDLLLLGSGVVQIFLNEFSLFGLRQLSCVSFQNAFDVALLGGGDPLQNMFFRFIALFQVDPVVVVVLVCCPFGVDRLLDDLLRGLCVQCREPEREYPDPEKVRLFFAHFSTAFVGQELRAFDAGDLPNGSVEKPAPFIPYCFGLHPRKYGGLHGCKKFQQEPLSRQLGRKT